MRADSCRTCGSTMKEFQRCTKCDEINKFICSGCKKPSDEQVHIRCGSMAREVILN